MRRPWPWVFLILACAACARPASPPVTSTSPLPHAAKLAGAGSAGDGGEARAEEAGRDLIGKPGPALRLRTIDGEVIDLAKFRGRRPVYLKFWATWCAPCLEQMPHFETVYETLGHDIAVVAVNTNFNETPAGVAAYRDKHGLKMPIVVDDGRLAAALNLRVTPQHVIIGQDGRIAYVGHLADARLDEALRAPRASLASQSPRPAPIPSNAEGPAVSTTPSDAAFAFRDPRGVRATALMFLSPWCETYLKRTQPIAAAECRSARELSEGLAAASGVRWLGIASGLWANSEDLQAYRRDRHVSIPLTLDASGRLFRAFHVTKVPTIVLIGRDGREQGRASGDVSGLRQLVERSGPAGRPAA